MKNHTRFGNRAHAEIKNTEAVMDKCCSCFKYARIYTEKFQHLTPIASLKSYIMTLLIYCIRIITSMHDIQFLNWKLLNLAFVKRMYLQLRFLYLSTSEIFIFQLQVPSILLIT